MMSLLISARYSDASVVLRSRHRSNNSLQTYHILLDRNGECQLATVFQGSKKFSINSGFAADQNGLRESGAFSNQGIANNKGTSRIKQSEAPKRARTERDEECGKEREVFGGIFAAKNCTVGGQNNRTT